jgi:hypothetical protein
MKEETKVLKIATLTAALVIGMVGGAYAQATGPAAQDNMKKPGINPSSDGMSRSGTTGASAGKSSGGGSGMTDKGGANGTPSEMPKTTTGPAGSASKTESPPK